MMDLWHSLKGFVEVELTSATPVDALFAANQHNIPIYNVRFLTELTVCFRIHRKDYGALYSLFARRGDKLSLLRKWGVYWTVAQLRCRPILCTGLAFLLFLVLYLPSRVLFVQVEGNRDIPTRKILAQAEACGIGFWADRSQVRSEKVKNALLSAIPELQWAGINTRGCTAVISVREREKSEQIQRFRDMGHMIAKEDAVIDEVVVIRGTGLCKPGQAVRQGQVLISGYVDCGICLRATGAEGEIYALTNHSIRLVLPVNFAYRGEEISIKRKITLLIRKKRINLWKDSGIWDAGCGRMYEEYYITLPGGFILPLALAVETYTQYHPAINEYVLSEQDMEAYAREYLLDHMVAGQIRSSQYQISRDADLIFLDGNFLCREMIGRVKREEIGAEYE